MEALRAHLDRYLPVRALFAGDYYPLTPWTIDQKQWLAFQFNDPQKRAGIVQAFCGDTAGREAFAVRLCGLEQDATYEVRNWDQPDSLRLTGRELMGTGLSFRATRPNDAVVFTYAVVPAGG